MADQPPEKRLIDADALIALLHGAAWDRFVVSNESRRPQWQRKAHAHAYAGLMQAIKIVEEQRIDS